MTDKETIKEMFKAVKVDEDTHLLGLSHGHLASLPVRQEVWNADGVKGASVIFRKGDVDHLSDEELKALVRNELNLEGAITLSRKSEFAFVNHSFRT